MFDTLMSAAVRLATKKYGYAGYVQSQSATRTLSDEDVEARRKRMELEMYNKDKQRGKDIDAFFLKYMEHQSSLVHMSATQTAKVTDTGDADHILEDAGDPDTEELRKLALELGIALEDLMGADITANGERELRKQDMERLFQKFGMDSLGNADCALLLVDLTGLDALSYADLKNAAIGEEGEKSVQGWADAYARAGAQQEAYLQAMERGGLYETGSLPDYLSAKGKAQSWARIAQVLGKLASAQEAR